MDRRLTILSAVALGLGLVGAAHAAGDRAEAQALLQEFLKPGADPAALARELRPQTADYRAVFGAELGKAAEAMYRADWDAGRIVIQPKEGQSELKVAAASTEELQKGAGEAREFPGGYGKLAPRLAAGLTIYRFKFVQPGQSLGLAFDGLVYVNGHFAFFPKPFRILAEQAPEK